MTHADKPGREIRARLDHPVIDCDAHVLEHQPAVVEYVRKVAGPGVVARLLKYQKERQLLDGQLAQYNQTGRGIWWGVPSGPHTGDRALAMLPRLFRARMDELGFDFAHLYSTFGIAGLYYQDDELRPAYCRALNALYADMFAAVGDRMRPVAVIPTFTPQEAIAELDHAVGVLGHKAIMIGTEVIRPVPGAGDRAPYLTRSIAIDPPEDYDPFWRRCAELGVAPVCHTASIGNAYYNSRSNYVFNHIGAFTRGSEYFCRALFFGGVTRRVPRLSFGFLEGGAAWGQELANAIAGHWEKRNAGYLEANLDPGKLDVDALARAAADYGGGEVTEASVRASVHGPLARPMRPEPFDEFAACGMKGPEDLRQLFIERFYFGCEADDRMTAVAFDRRLSPVGEPLRAVFGSDIGHWDVSDAMSVLTEAWEMVDHELMSPGDFRAFTFENPAMLHLSVNPNYFRGTVLEAAAEKLLRDRAGRA